MKNYYTTLQEIKLCEIRIEVLEERKKMLLASITPKTSKIKDVVAFGGGNNSEIEDCIIRIEKTENEIKQKEREIKMLQSNLKKMEEALRKMNEVMEQIFTLYYIDGKNPRQIANVVHYDISTIYRYLDKIKKML